jgi:hypothetical protein
MGISGSVLSVHISFYHRSQRQQYQCSTANNLESNIHIPTFNSVPKERLGRKFVRPHLNAISMLASLIYTSGEL